MKPILPALVFIVFTVASCGNAHTPANKQAPKAEVPKALKKENSDVNLSSFKRGGDDLVESIYEEPVEKTPALKQLEDEIINIQESKADSTSAFDLYDGKNTRYYLAAGSHLAGIKDSVLRERITQLINNSQSDYTNSVAQHSGLVNTIAVKEIALNDMHIVLKLMTTLQAVQNYQKTGMPSTKPLEGIVKQYDKLTQQADKLAKQ